MSTKISAQINEHLMTRTPNTLNHSPTLAIKALELVAHMAGVEILFSNMVATKNRKLMSNNNEQSE